MVVAHRDLKPENLLVINRYPFHVKISDFGKSKVVRRDGGFLKIFYKSLLYTVPKACSNGKKGYRPLVNI